MSYSRRYKDSNELTAGRSLLPCLQDAFLLGKPGQSQTDYLRLFDLQLFCEQLELPALNCAEADGHLFGFGHGLIVCGQLTID
jgi:hypothetical protein